MKKYRLVGTLNPFGDEEYIGIASMIEAIYQDEDGHLYSSYIDDDSETPWAIAGFLPLYDDEIYVKFIDNNTVIETEQEYYEVGDIAVAGIKKEDESIYMGRLDNYVMWLKEYHNKLTSNDKNIKLPYFLCDYIEFFGGIVAKGNEAGVFKNKVLNKKMN